jgi:tRNA dimethylallyltransferase
MQTNTVIIIFGPTASGKSQAAIDLAKKIGGVIINADSMQIYQELPILTAIPQHTNGIPHKLFQILSGDTKSCVANWINLVRQEIDAAFNANLTPIIVGGTAMYIRLLIDGLSNIPNIPNHIMQAAQEKFNTIGAEKFYQELQTIDPLLSDKIKPTDVQRTLRAYCVKIHTGESIISFQTNRQTIWQNEKLVKIAINPPRETVYQNCNNRFIDIINCGGIEEVQQLIQLNYPNNAPVMHSIGVPEIISYLQGKISKKQMIIQAQQSTRNYAKRQYTWLNNKFHDFIFTNSNNILDSIAITI